MTPPAGRPAQPEEARGLRGDAVRRDHLLLLADRVQETQRVDTEADQSEDRERRQAQCGARRRPCALTCPRSAEHEERQHEPRGDLDADTRDQRCRAGAHARRAVSAQRERERQRQQDQRVVVGAADREHEQHRVQAHERRGRSRRAAEARGRPRDQRHGGKARGGGGHLERPQRPGHSQRRGRVACEREQWAVWGVQERPAHERVDLIGARFGGDVGVWVEAVQRAQARERRVAEDIEGDQRRPEQHDHVGRDDPRREQTRRQHARAGEHEQVARAHDQNQRLKAGVRERGTDSLQRPGQPAGPAAGARGHIAGWFGGGVGAQQQSAGEDSEQAQRGERPLHARPPPSPCLLGSRIGRARGAA
ncbi:MAG: hypothetical protein QOI03_1733 [Solirubrobacteraceae bacterium]|nr:hypothetical protein [Solirubrobacteraceae bacterium]